MEFYFPASTIFPYMYHVMNALKVNGTPTNNDSSILFISLVFIYLDLNI